MAPLGKVVVVMTGGVAELVMVIDNCLVLLPALLEAFTVNVDVPAAVGVPLMIPELNRFNPVGKAPFSKLHVIGAVPEASSCALYAVPVAPLGKDVVVITGATAELVTTIDNAFVSLPTLLVALTVKLEVPAVLGVPEMMPADDSVNPAGKLPLCNDHVIGVVPEAASCALYVVPVKPPGRVVVVMNGGSSTVMLNDLVSLPTALVAFTVKLKVPAADGVPEMTPAVDSVNPVGKLPLLSVQVMGVVPVAVSC